MSVIMIEGFDTYNGTGATQGLGTKWGVNNAGLTTGRIIGQCMTWTGSALDGSATRTLSTGYATLSWCCAIQAVSLPSGAGPVANLAIRSGGTYMVGLGVNSSGAITAYRLTGLTAGTALGPASPNNTILAGNWHYIEWSTFISDTVGTVLVKVDGIVVINLTGIDTRNGTPTTVDTLYCGPGGAGAGMGSWRVDDMYCTDNTTTYGDCQVETLYANADTAMKMWIPNAGVTNYTQMDEALCDGDTTYVSSSVLNDLDLYDFANMATTPLNVYAVQLGSYARKTDAGTRAIANACKSGATTDVGVDFSLTTSYARKERILELDPNTGAAWAAAAVNALQAGPKVTI